MSDIEQQQPPPGVDGSVPSAARMYDYFLGGKLNYPVDRAAADVIVRELPEVDDMAWSNRGFLQRAVKWVGAQGIRQFIDIGAGLPTQNTTHEVARRVRLHANAILEGDERIAAIRHEMRDTDAVLGDPELRELIDFSEPVALLFVAVTHFLSDADDPWGLVARYLDRFPPGSYLVLSAITADYQQEQRVSAISDVYSKTPYGVHFRTRDEIARYFDGLEIVPPYEGAEPGLTYVGYWGAEDLDEADSDGSRWSYCAVARVPEEES